MVQDECHSPERNETHQQTCPNTVIETTVKSLWIKECRVSVTYIYLE